MVRSKNKILDRLLEVPYEGSPGALTETRVDEVASELSLGVPGSWQEEDSSIFIPGLKAVTALALLPALRAIARDEVQDLEVAKAVNDNLIALGRTILDAEAFKCGDVHGRSNDRGMLGEFSVLGALWWLTANTHLPESYCTLPTLASEDMANTQDGYKMGADLIVTDTAGEEEDAWVQVKTSEHLYNGRNYHPATVKLSVSRMAMFSHGNPLKLISIINNNEEDLLSEMAFQVRECFDEAKARNIIDQAT